jgi:hypothetical protein
VLIGGIFLQTGDDAKRPFANVKFCLSVLVFFLYTHIMTPVLLCESLGECFPICSDIFMIYSFLDYFIYCSIYKAFNVCKQVNVRDYS